MKSLTSANVPRMSAEKQHDLYSFMSQISQEMAAEYEQIRMRATEDPGTAGDQGEENWATLLKGWLPPTYQVETKGRLISHDGTTSPQVDVVVLKPVCPRKLLDKKLYLAAGVAAAFECKTTLTGAHLREAVEKAVAVKSLFRHGMALHTANCAHLSFTASLRIHIAGMVRPRPHCQTSTTTS